MTNREDILNELTELQSILTQAPTGSGYNMPPGYFDGFADQVLRRVKALDSLSVQEELSYLSSLLSQASKVNTYTVPANYFSELEQSIHFSMDQSSAEEIAGLSPLLSGLKKQSPFEVPIGYFESLTSPIKKEESKPAAKVISMMNRSWMRYAAAAVVTGFVVVSSLILLNKKDSIDPDTKSFAWVEKSMNKVSTEDINKFVELTGEDNGVIAKVSAEEDIKNLLNDVDDKEIQEFLNDTESAESDTEDELLN